MYFPNPLGITLTFTSITFTFLFYSSRFFDICFFFIASLRNFFDLVFRKTTSFCRSLSQATFDLQKKCFFFCPPFYIPLANICVFIIDVCASIMNPPVVFMVLLFLALAYISSTTNPERITFLVFFRFPHYSANSADVF